MSSQQSNNFYGADTLADHLEEHGYTRALQGSITLAGGNLSNAAQALSLSVPAEDVTVEQLDRFARKVLGLKTLLLRWDSLNLPNSFSFREAHRFLQYPIQWLANSLHHRHLPAVSEISRRFIEHCFVMNSIQPAVFPRPPGIVSSSPGAALPMPLLPNPGLQSSPRYVPSSPPMTGNLSALGNSTESDPLP
ncbi:hypothetical protein C8J56DRAFT_1049846 [Mycena floridula]|nr:hypothetical protein C8J56DRAFT_1049846 [Mycena floridula]